MAADTYCASVSDLGVVGPIHQEVRLAREGGPDALHGKMPGS
jgi:hypothetical protein